MLDDSGQLLVYVLGRDSPQNVFLASLIVDDMSSFQLGSLNIPWAYYCRLSSLVYSVYRSYLSKLDYLNHFWTRARQNVVIYIQLTI